MIGQALRPLQLHAGISMKSLRLFLPQIGMSANAFDTAFGRQPEQFAAIGRIGRMIPLTASVGKPLRPSSAEILSLRKRTRPSPRMVPKAFSASLCGCAENRNRSVGRSQAIAAIAVGKIPASGARRVLRDIANTGLAKLWKPLWSNHCCRQDRLLGTHEIRLNWLDRGSPAGAEQPCFKRSNGFFRSLWMRMFVCKPGIRTEGCRAADTRATIPSVRTSMRREFIVCCSGGTMALWSEALSRALVSGSASEMKSALAHVPRSVLDLAAPYIAALAKTRCEQGNLGAGLACYDQLLEIAPDNMDWLAARAVALADCGRFDDSLADADRWCGLQPQSAGAHEARSRALEGGGDIRSALAAAHEALRLGANDAAPVVKRLDTVLQKKELLDRIANSGGNDASTTFEVKPPPTMRFNPEVHDAEALSAELEAEPMFKAVQQHLWRYSVFQSARNAISRIEDTAWLAAWDEGLRGLRGEHALFHGSEVGLLPLRAAAHGALSVTVLEPYPLESRICAGVVQKNQLLDWHRHNASLLEKMSQEEREESFEAWSKGIRLIAPDEFDSVASNATVLVVPAIDHTLLGTGIVAAARRFIAKAGPAGRVLPGRARIFAAGIQWCYPGTPYQLDALNDLRWNIYAETLEIPDEGWMALTETVPIATIDFAQFDPAKISVDLPVHTTGTLDAILFWFELDIGGGHFSNAPGRVSGNLRPAVQYSDPRPLVAGDWLPLDVHITESRLDFRTRPRSSQERSSRLPSWYVPMILDHQRNDAYRDALQRMVGSRPPQLALDIGAGCGLLSMLAVDAGVRSVVGCEVQPAIHRIGESVLRRNGKTDQATIIRKDCLQLALESDIPQRADLVLFELFDCSLIGEGVLHFLQHVREHLAEKDARYLPMSARIRGQVIENRIGEIWGLDANLINPFRFSADFQNVDARKLNYRPLTDAFDIFKFDFATATVTAEDHQITMEATEAGVAGAVLFWFDVQMDEFLWLSNAPSSTDRLHWKQGLQFLPEIEALPGMQLPLQAHHNGSSLSFRWNEAAVPDKAYSRLPRFDPASAQQTRELEMQTQQLMQHCLAHPAEYEKVANLALKLAVDPGRYGLDGRIAQRFATSFLAR